MADGTLTALVEKESIRLVMPKMWSVSIKLTITDIGSGPGFVKIFSQNYKLDQSIPALGAKFLAEMQADIAQYARERAYFDNAQFTSLVSGLQAAVEV